MSSGRCGRNDSQTLNSGRCDRYRAVRAIWASGECQSLTRVCALHLLRVGEGFEIYDAVNALRWTASRVGARKPGVGVPCCSPSLRCDLGAPTLRDSHGMTEQSKASVSGRGGAFSRVSNHGCCGTSISGRLVLGTARLPARCS